MMNGSSALLLTTAPLYAGNYLAAVLYGITTIQAYLYYKAYLNDPRSIKILVAVLWMIDSMHAVLAAYGVFEDLVNLERDPLPVFFNRVPWSISTTVLLTSLSDTAVRCFYLRRIWKLSDSNRILAALIAVPVTVSLAFGLYLSIQLYCLKEALEILTQKTSIYGVLTSSCASDWIITVVTSVLLWREQSSFKRTNSLINAMIMSIVTTGLFPSIFALVTVAVYAAIPGFFFVGIYLILSKLYLNSLLATLNSRQSLNNQRQNDPMFSLPLSTNAQRCGEASQHTGSKSTIRGQDLTVQVDTEMSRAVDPVPMRPQEWKAVMKFI